MTDQKYKDLMNGGWSYPKKESTDPEEVKKVVDKYLTDNKIDSLTIDKKITDGISKIVADAPEDFDTLKEMSDWISQHSDSAAAMNSDILDNKSSIETLQKDKANATDVETLSSEVENNTNDISDLSTDMKRIFNHKNLIGNTLAYYPVFIKSGSTITCSTYDGSVSSVTEAVIEFYDKNKTKLDAYSSILSGNSSRTFTLTCDDVYYVKWKTLPTIPIQMELGDRATSYEEYIDDYNFNAIVDVNSSMSDYGLNNVFDGELLAGNYDIYNSGSFISIISNHMSSKNYISCKEGDTIKIKYGKAVTNQMHFTFFKADGTYISSSVSGQVSEFSAVAPSECSKFMFTVIDTTENHCTIDTCYPISVYINNQIDVVMNDVDVLSGEVETLKTEVNNNTNAISEIKANITTNIYNLNDVVKGKWITDKNGSTGSSASWVYLPLNVKGLKTVTISALGGTASWNKHYFNDSNGTTIDYNNSQVTVSVPSDATILYVNIYEEFTDINAIKITTESVGEVVTDINASLSVLGKCKNLLKLKVDNMTQTGITLEVDNGKIHVYGTATENTFIHIADITLKKGVSYKLCSQPFTSGNVYLLNGTIYQNNVYTPSKDAPQTVVLNIWNGQTVDFYITPMITTNINATYDDFVPYTGDEDTLTADVAKIKNDVDVLKNDKEDKYTLVLNNFTNCVNFENVVNTDEYFEAMVFDRSDKKKYIKVSGYRPSEDDEENEISYINLGSKTLNIVGSNNQVIMFSGGSEVYDAYIKAIR